MKTKINNFEESVGFAKFSQYIFYRTYSEYMLTLLTADICYNIVIISSKYSLFYFEGIAPGDVQEVYMGNVISAAAGQAPARQATLAAGK